MKLKINNIALVATLALSPLLLHAQSVTIADPDFETPQDTPTFPVLGGILGGIAEKDYSSAPLANNFLNGTSGWYVTPAPTTPGAGSVAIINQGIFNQGIVGKILNPITGDGSNQFLVLNGEAIGVGALTPGAIGGVQQVVTTAKNQDYEMTFQAAALSVLLFPASSAPLYAGVANGTVTSGGLLNLTVGNFQTYNVFFTSDGTGSTAIDFHETGGLVSVGGIAIDNVSVTAVPEPRDYAAMFLGGALFLLVVRRWKASRLPLDEAMAMEPMALEA